MKRILALILALVMTMALVACGGDKPTSSTPSSTPNNPTQSSKPTEPSQPSQPTEPSKPAEPAKPAEPKIFRRAESTAAGTAYALMSQVESESNLQSLINAKLYQFLPIDGKSVLSPVLAAEAPIDVNGDGKTWNIKMNPNAKWENGEAITAETMEYSLKVALDPKLVMQYAGTVAKGSYITIVGAQDYLEGKTAWENVGIKALDAQTLQIVTAEENTATLVMRNFSSNITAPVYPPLFEKCLSADGLSTTYGATKDNIMSSGPFKLTKWVQGSIREFEKNENYVRADLIKLDGYVQPVVEDANTRLQMFESGELHNVSLTTAALKDYGDDPRVVTVPSKYIRNFDFCGTSTVNPILGNENFRLACYYATDRATIAKLSGDAPATAYISPLAVAYDDGTTFRSLAAKAGYDQLDNYGYDPAKAKAYFDKALQEVGVSKVEVTLLCSQNADHKVISEYIQEDWAKIFGADRFKLNINSQPSATQLAQKRSCKTDPNAYDITISDYTRADSMFDPLKGVMQFKTTYSSPNAPYTDTKIDEMYDAADTAEYRLNLEVRAQAAMEIEKYMIEHATSVPVIYNSTYQMVADDIELALGEYDDQLGWGFAYCDIKQ